MIILVILKKEYKTGKTSYHPLSILPNLSKVYQRLMCNQIFPFLDSVFSKFQRGFRKRFDAQQYPRTIVEKWRKILGKGDKMGAALKDLSKAFGCIDQDLLIAKLNVYVFENMSLEVIDSYLTKLKEKNKPNLARSLVLGKCHFQVFQKG